jgi:hypothetical protein
MATEGVMLWLMAACIAFGTLCGLVFRFPAFLAIGIAAAIAAIVSRDFSDLAQLMLALALAVSSLQIGYGLGILLRALVHGMRDRRGG